MNRDIELLTDMFRDEENPFGTIIETGKEDHYYSSFGIHLLKEFENNDHYYHFLMKKRYLNHHLHLNQQYERHWHLLH